MSRTPSSRVFPLAAAGLVLGCLGGCYNPDFGAGNFSCEEGSCPEGYTCVSEGARQVCRKQGAPLPDSGTDQRVADLPSVFDGQGPDGPLADAPRSDVLSLDGLLVDQAQSDAAPDGAADALAVDAGLADQLRPDLYPHPLCLAPEVVTKDVRSEPQSVDLVMDSQGLPHVVLADASSTLGHTWRTSANSWRTVSTVGPTATKVGQLAAAISLPTSGAEHLHVIYSRASIFSPGVLHTFLDLQASGGQWAAPATVVNQSSVSGLDIGAAGINAYLAVSGTGTLVTDPLFSPYRLSYFSGNYNFKPLDSWQNNTFSDTRVGVGPTQVAFSVHQEANSLSRSWGVSRLTHSASSGTSILINSAAASPAAVAVSAAGQVHLAYVRRSGNQTLGTLHYATWGGLTGTKPVEMDLISQISVVASSVDLVLDAQGQPILTFLLKGQGLMAYHRSSGSWVLYPLVAASASTVSRAVVDQGVLQVIYDEGAGGLDPLLNYLRCQLP